MTGAQPLLEIKGLNAGYGGIDVLHDIDIEMHEGEFVCIIGANTAGKSTILRTISRLVPNVRGTLRLTALISPRALHTTFLRSASRMFRKGVTSSRT